RAIACALLLSFCFNDLSPSLIYTLSLHDALPIFFCSEFMEGSAHCSGGDGIGPNVEPAPFGGSATGQPDDCRLRGVVVAVQPGADRKSTRLNSSHVAISYAVFCLKKKKKNKHNAT